MEKEKLLLLPEIEPQSSSSIPALKNLSDRVQLIL
jgi:hypothetical protein